MIKNWFLLCFFITYLFVLPVIVFTQPSEAESAEQEQALEGSEPSEEPKPLPVGFMNIFLGMDLDTVKNELLNNNWFDYKGPPDVTMLNTPDLSLIECDGRAFVEKAYFQFHKEKLFIITIVLNQQRIDFYTMHTAFEEKYGKAFLVNPTGAYWENETVNISVEKPVRVKYMDKVAMEAMEAGRVEIEDRDLQNKYLFLELF